MKVQRPVVSAHQPTAMKRLPSDKGASAKEGATVVMAKDSYHVAGVGYPAYAKGSAGNRTRYRPFEGLWGAPFALTRPGAPGVDLLVEPYNQTYAIDPESGKVASQQSCGTTSLAMLMNYFRPGSADQAAIDQAIRRSNKASFTSPLDIVAYANQHGFRASMTNHATVEDLARMIDQGAPVQVLMEPLRSATTVGPDPNDFGIHYTVVNGYTRDPKSGAIAEVIVSDPWGLHYSLPVADFERHWGNLKLKGLDTGLDRMFISMVPAEGTLQRPDGQTAPAASVALPTAAASDAIWAATAVAGGAMDVRNAAAGHDAAQGVGEVASGLVKAVGGGLGWALGAVGLPEVGGRVALAAAGLGEGAKAVVRAVEDGAKSLWGALSSL